MSRPNWYDRRGFESWVEGVAEAFGRRVTVSDVDGVELLSAGAGEGDGLRIPVEVNGVEVAVVEIVPSVGPGEGRDRLDQAVETLRALAEVRNSMADLVRTTAQQWRELNVLYRSSALLRGGLAPETVAQHLLDQTTRALRGTVAGVRFRRGDDLDFVASDDAATRLAPVAEWGEALEVPALAADQEELARLGYDGDAPSESLIVVPLVAGERRLGALAVASVGERVLGADHLKLARLLADQAGQAFANVELIEQVRESERIERELQVASEIQTSILPPPELVLDRLEVVGVCRPAQWVGGDVYLATPVADGSVIVAVADVSGHGVSSALLMNAFASQLTALARTDSDPSRLLASTNDLVAARVGSMGMFVTTVVGRIEPDGGCRLAGAGHPPPIVIDPDGVVRLVELEGLPLGILEGEIYPAVEIDFPAGTSLLAYSDGVTEASDPGGTMLGVEGLAEMVARRAGEGARGQVLLDLVLADLGAFTAQASLDDDLTLVVTRRTS